MSAALSKALDEISFRIPKPILDAVFIQRENNYRNTPVSIDEMLLVKVIRPRVLVDCNLVGGTEVSIALSNVPTTRSEDYTVAAPYTTVYRIPKSMTQGRSITSVLNIMFSNSPMASTYGGMGGNQNSTMMNAGSAVMDAMGSIPMTSTANIQLIGENVVMVRDNVLLPVNIYLRCVLANDENMSHLQLKSYRAFADLAVLAVKAYIYNSYIIQMDLGELHGGQQLGRFKEIIDNYADAEELYGVYITEKWQKISFMNDRESMTRFMKLLTGGHR